jgi:nitrate reductase NapD
MDFPMNRRELFQGGAADDNKITHVASAVISALPHHLVQVRAHLAVTRGVEVVAVHNHKIVLLLEASGRDAIGSLLTQISLLEGVLSANLVFEGSYEDEDAA